MIRGLGRDEGRGGWGEFRRAKEGLGGMRSAAEESGGGGLRDEKD